MSWTYLCWVCWWQFKELALRACVFPLFRGCLAKMDSVDFPGFQVKRQVTPQTLGLSCLPGQITGVSKQGKQEKYSWALQTVRKSSGSGRSRHVSKTQKRTKKCSRLQRCSFLFSLKGWKEMPSAWAFSRSVWQKIGSLLFPTSYASFKRFSKLWLGKGSCLLHFLCTGRKEIVNVEIGDPWLLIPRQIRDK